MGGINKMRRRKYFIYYEGNNTNITFAVKKQAEDFIKNREGLLSALKAKPNSYTIVSSS
jgi:hypothetical protein